MSASPITEVTKDSFTDEVLKSDRLVLVDFYADWCGPCRAMAPALAQFAAENPQVKVVKINVDTSPELAAAFNVQSIPTLVTLKDGRALVGAMGNLPKRAIEELVRQALQEAAKTNIETKPAKKAPRPK
jgi:thioredoxin 1